MTNTSKKKGPRTLQLNNENNLQNIKENQYDGTGVPAENNIYSDIKDI